MKYSDRAALVERDGELLTVRLMVQDGDNEIVTSVVKMTPHAALMTSKALLKATVQTINTEDPEKVALLDEFRTG